jgi:hypothetical protein
MLLLYLITLRDTHKFDRTPLDKGSVSRRGLYLHNTKHSQKKRSMPLTGFESAITAIKPPQTYALDRTATGIDRKIMYELNTDGRESEKG